MDIAICYMREFFMANQLEQDLIEVFKLDTGIKSLDEPLGFEIVIQELPRKPWDVHFFIRGWIRGKELRRSQAYSYQPKMDNICCTGLSQVE